MEVTELKEKVLQHAYIVSGSAERGAEEVLKMLEKRGVETKGNADVFVRSYPELSVDEARSVSSFAELKALGERKYLVIAFSRATGEAQNALLKVLEEAPGSSVFFLCVDAAGHLLPTIRSRCVGIQLTADSLPLAENAEAEEFLKESYEKRLARVEKMVAYVSKTQDRASVREFVASLMREAHERGMAAAALRDLLDADRYLRLSGSSVKAILGHLAVSLPPK